MIVENINLEGILDRVRTMKGEKSDVGLASILGVSRQTLATWKKRDTIPYGPLFKFARDEGVSLDYLLLGRGTLGYGGEIDPVLMEGIYHELADATAHVSSNVGYHASLIYNRVIKRLLPGQNWGTLVSEEIKYLSDILERQGRGEIPVPVYIEEARTLLRTGSSPEEANAPFNVRIEPAELVGDDKEK